MAALILLQVVLIALNAIFACTEIAVISVNDNKLARMAEQGDKRAQRLVKLTGEPAKFLATIQVAITVSGFLGSAFAADNFSDTLVNWLIGLGVKMPRTTLDTLAVILITLILSYFTLVFGELVPKRVAMRKAEPLALAVSGMISTIARLFAPIVWFLSVSTNTILRLLGIDPNEQDEEVGEEEIRMMVDAGSEQGTIDKNEQELIHKVFEFDNLTAAEIATHRTEVAFLWEDGSQEEWDQTILSTRHTYYPVCGKSVDDIKGILNTKEYFRLSDRKRERVMQDAVKPALFVTENVRADMLFRMMKQNYAAIVVVLDEYGGVCGILTTNDLVSRLVGDLPEEIQEEASIVKVDEKTWELRGSVDLEELKEETGIVLLHEDYETFSGFVFHTLGMIPKDGEQMTFETNGLQVQILEVRGHQVEKALLIRL